MRSRLHFAARDGAFWPVFSGGEKVAHVFDAGLDSFWAMVKANPDDYETELHWPYEHAGEFETLAEARAAILARHFGNA